MFLRTAISWSLLTLGLFLAPPPLPAQPTTLPTPAEVKALQAKYQDEHDRIVKEGVAARFLPALMAKADELAKKSAAALASGRTLQASQAIRQARWQLPYQPATMPANVSRIIGNLRLRHSSEINTVAYSPDGGKLASASSDGVVKVWDLGDGHELLTYTGHTAKVRSLAWLPDGQAIASAGNEKNIKIWDAATGKDLKTIVAVGEQVSALLLSRDGKHLFTGQLGGNPTTPLNGLFVYEVATGKLLREVRDYKNFISTLALNADGTILATGDGNGYIRLWQYPRFIENADQPAYWSQQDLNGAVYQLVFSPDDKTILRVGAIDLKFYAVTLPGAPFQAAAPLHTIRIDGSRCAAYSKDGKTFFIGDLDGNIHFWDSATRVLQGTFKNAHSAHLNALAFNPDGTQLASCGGDYTIRLWDFDVVLQAHDFEGHNDSVWTAAFSPDSQKIVSASADKTVKVWQRDTGKILLNLTEHHAPVTAALFSPDGKLIASVGGDKTLRIWDAETGKLLRTGDGHQGTITCLDFSADSKRIVTGSVDRRIKIWNADTGKEILSINDNPSIVAGVAFHPDGKQVAVANVDQTIRLYDAADGKLQHSWNAHGVSVNGVAYSPDGLYLASCGGDMLVQIWPLATPGANAIRLAGHTGPVSMVAFRKDNQHLVSGGADQLIKLWKLEGNAGKELKTFRGHKDWVTSVAFSKEGHHVLSSSVDRRIKIWEMTSRELPLLAEHTSAVVTVVVSPDNRIIATGSNDRTIKLWDRATGVEIATLTGPAGAPMSLVFTPDSKELISSQEDKSIRLWGLSPPREIPRTPEQLTGFRQLRHDSPYLFLDPKGETLFVWLPMNEASVSTIVEAYDVKTGTQLFTFNDGTRKVNSLAFCANARLAATGGKDGSVRLWQIDKKEAKPAPGGDWSLFDKIGVADLALTPDGATLIATNDKGELKIAQIAGRKVVHTIQAHEGQVMVCMVSPDGKRCATFGEDTMVKLWDVATGKELRRWDFGKQQGKWAIRNLAFSADGRQLITANANTTVFVLELP